VRKTGEKSMHPKAALSGMAKDIKIKEQK
jgi:hypothetical protein